MNQRLPTLDYATPATGSQRQLATIRFVAVVFAAIALIGLFLLCVSAKADSSPALLMTLFGTFGNGVSFTLLLRHKHRAS
jgi:hypothetical protein